jgi:hypothetical protein
MALCDHGKGSASVWFKFVAASAGRVYLNTMNSDYDTVVTLWKNPSGNTLTAIACDDDGNYVDGSSVGDYTSYLWNVPVTAGTYYVEVIEYAGSLPYDASGGPAVVKPLAADAAVGGELALDFAFAPVLTVPSGYVPATNSYANTLTPTLSWNTVPNAEWYWIDIDTTLSFKSPVAIYEQSNTNSFTVDSGDIPSDGVWYWRVASGNVAGLSAFSAGQKLTIDTAPPAIPVLNMPAAETGVSTGGRLGMPTFTWGAVSTATQYKVEILEDSGIFAPVVYTQLVSGTSHLPTFATAGQFYWRVSARDAAGNWSAPSASRGVFVTPKIPLAPVLVAPANALLSNAQYQVFDWNPVAWADVYQIQFDTVPSFTSGAYLELNFAAADTEADMSILSNALYEGINYWRVVAINADGSFGAFSAVRTLNNDRTPPADVTGLLSPIGNAQVLGLTPKFTWPAVPTAVKYNLVVSNDNFSTTVVNVLVTTPSYTLTAAQALNLEQYEWRVYAIDAIGNVSGQGDTEAFMPTILSAPVHGSSTTDTTPMLTWIAMPGAITYHVQLDDDSGFGSPEYDTDVSAPGLSVQINDLLLGTYYWRVQVMTTASDPAFGAYTPAKLFSVTLPALPAPVIIGPANNALITTQQPELEWTNPNEASTIRYWVQVDNNSNFASPEVDTWESNALATSLAVSVPTDGTWYWRMRIENTTGAMGPYSAVRIMKVDTTPPAAPILLSPADGGGSVGHPTFTWTAVPGAAGYKLIIGSTGACDGAYVSDLIKVTSFKPLVVLDDIIYMNPAAWRVCAYDAAGNGAPSAERVVSITEGIPAAPMLSFPANAAVIQKLDPDILVLQWSWPLYASDFFIQIANNPAFNSLVLETTTGGDNHYNFDPDTAGGVYYWRVLAGSTAGDSAYSPTRSFTVDNTGPAAAPALSMPANGGVITTATTAFKWMTTMGATRYEFQIDEQGQSFGSLYYGNVNVMGTTLTPPALPIGVYEWRVRGLDAVGNPSPWSATSTLNVNVAAPAVPVLTTANNAVFPSISPFLDWADAARATMYNIQISTNAAFTNIIENSAGPSASEFTPSNITLNGVYYWRVRSTNVHGVQSAFSASRMFTVDTANPPVVPFVAPADNATSVGNPLFKWTKPADTAFMRLQIDEDGGDFSTLLYDSGWVTVVQLTPPVTAFSGLGSFDWRVISKDAAGNETAGSNPPNTLPVRSINITVPVPSVVPTLTSPANKAVISDNTPDFVWTSVPYGDHYEIWVDTAAGFPMPRIVDYDGVMGVENLSLVEGGPGYPGSPFPDGTYYWWVWGYNTNNQHSAKWSALYSFTIDTVAPASAPITSMPANLALLRNVQPAFKWTALSGATQYQIEVSNDGFSTILYTSPWVTGTTFTPPIATLAQDDYDWRIRSRDAAGNVGPDSSLKSFSIVEPIPAAPILTAPVANASTTDNTPSFSWTGVAFADHYEIQVDNNNNFSSPEYQGAFFSGDSIVPVPNGTYYWRVRAVNARGEPGAYAPTRILKIVP